MMAGLFLLFALSIFFLYQKKYKSTLVLTIITLILCAFMLIYHATSDLGIRL